MFFMLILVLAANYVLLFVGWEGVGLASYLLIVSTSLKKSASDAGKKKLSSSTALATSASCLACFTYSKLSARWTSRNSSPKPHCGPTNPGRLRHLHRRLPTALHRRLRQIAQLPLYVWLPTRWKAPRRQRFDSRRTMVTAGVYVVARSHILFTHSETAMVVVAIVGCATAFFAATIGLVQTDIKKVLAYSTVSQLGYMFLGCGVGAFGAGISI